MIESKIDFNFNNNWKPIIQFDKHIDYKKLEKIGSFKDIDKERNLVSVRGPKAVDFLGILDNKLYFIEVKNFRNYRIENKDKLENTGENLMISVAHKVKDSLACIIGGSLNSTNDKELWQKSLKILSDEKKIKVILWLEMDTALISENVIRQKNKEKKGYIKKFDYQRKLYDKLKWFINSQSNVRILNTENYQNNLSFEAKLLKE